MNIFNLGVTETSLIMKAVRYWRKNRVSKHNRFQGRNCSPGKWYGGNTWAIRWLNLVKIPFLKNYSFWSFLKENVTVIWCFYFEKIGVSRWETIFNIHKIPTMSISIKQCTVISSYLLQQQPMNTTNFVLQALYSSIGKQLKLLW